MDVATKPLFGINVFSETKEKLKTYIQQDISQNKKSVIALINTDHILRHSFFGKFKNLYRTVKYSLIDGVPVLWTARLCGMRNINVIAGEDLICSIFAWAEQNRWRVAIIGGNPRKQTLEKALDRIRRDYPGLKLSFKESPAFGFEADGYVETLVAHVQDCPGEILFVALGTPRQEYFIEQYKKILPYNVFIGIGASLDFFAGTVHSMPPWMRKYGLGWTHRLWQEPHRLFLRYASALLIFPICMVVEVVAYWIKTFFKRD